MYSGSLEDRTAIRELHEVYADGVVMMDKDIWASVWADDATWDFMGNLIEGKPAIVELWVGAMSAFDKVSFQCMPCALQVDGDTATARVQTQEILKGKDGSTRHVGGLYTDKLAKIGGQWLYTHRAFEIVAEFRPEEG